MRGARHISRHTRRRQLGPSSGVEFSLVPQHAGVWRVKRFTLEQRQADTLLGAFSAPATHQAELALEIESPAATDRRTFILCATGCNLHRDQQATVSEAAACTGLVRCHVLQDALVLASFRTLWWVCGSPSPGKPRVSVIKSKAGLQSALCVLCV